MNKKSVIIFSILALVIIAFAVNYFFSSSIKLVPPIFITGAIATEKGMVIENVTKNVEVDAPTYLRVKKEGGILSGSEIKAIYHTGEAPCVNPIPSAFNIKKGNTIEIHGVAIAYDTISTCESKDYYIKSANISQVPAVISDKGTKFSGEVIKGKNFEKEIGNNLFFRLVPAEFGWTISVGTKTGKTSVKDVGYEEYYNFAGVVTPPYRGINNIYIEGWHFRNSDNTGPHAADPKNVNAPQEVRGFNFVLNDSDYQKASDALNKLLWSYSYSEQEVDEAATIHAKLSKGHGTLTIRDFKLNNLVVGDQAGIESMKFDVELDFP